MSDLAIRMEGVGKLYRICALQKQHKTLRDALPDMLRSPFRRLGAALAGRPQPESDDLWALRDVSFELSRGQVLGIIGRNGAGKSTLLKILSRITDPTEGTMGIKGRIASLLEVGTGFHPELTGRENVYLNGAILGMRRGEIARKFDEIIAFAELERFVDTQVKHYSSGMYMRLAFAVAAHLEPEILIVDEVLAVGDSSFQKKCLGQMHETASGGATVLFVSHNMSAISQLCSHALWMDRGRVKSLGACAPTIASYLRAQDAARDGSPLTPVDTTKDAQFRAAWCIDAAGEKTRTFSADESAIVCVVVDVHRRSHGLYGAFDIVRHDGTLLLKCYSTDMSPNPLQDLDPGSYQICLPIPPRLLGHGEYRVEFALANLEGYGARALDAPGSVVSFDVNEMKLASADRRPGLLSTFIPWELTSISPAPRETRGDA